jgi:hypothetical protein
MLRWGIFTARPILPNERHAGVAIEGAVHRD